jgi:diguanylate cyclase (GGDEF)-like protein/PAS domain S-box-containing protein
VAALVAGHVGVALLVATAADEPVWSNAAFRSLWADAATSSGLADAADAVGAPAFFAVLGPAAQGRRRGPGRWPALAEAPDGAVRWLDVRCRRLDGPGAQDDLLLYEVADVTASRACEELSRQRELRLSRVESLASVGTWEWDVATGHVVWSDQLLTLFGLSRECELTYERYRSMVHPDDVALIEGTLERALARCEPFSYTHRMVMADMATERVFECFGEVLTDAQGAPVGVLGTAHDITERQRAEDELAALAALDPLTGLANRRAFTQLLEERVGAGAVGDAALLLVDVDNFKDVNDLRGHVVGDQVMCGLARLLPEHAGPGAVVARLGGDEFAVLLAQVDPGQALARAERLCDAVARTPVLAGGQALRVSVSVGVAPVEPRSGPTEVLAAADLALYEAKGAGRNRARLFDPGQYETAARRVSVLERVRRALEDGALALHAQPVVDLGSGAVVAHELLVRLEDGLQPHLGPAEFLPALERTDLVLRLDRWVVEQAVAALALPRARERQLVLHVNVSTRTLEDPGFAEHVIDLLASAGVEPRRLGLEITETAALTNLEAARRLALRLTAAGCRFSLDDFGAGFASFSYLKHLPFTTVKIDGEFVQHADEDGVDAVLVDAVVRVARGLGMSTTAEHVDREALVDVLRRLGVDQGQGRHLGAPRPLLEVVSAPTTEPAPAGARRRGGVR